ncbi:MAG TPA: NUDIX hydrolase [Acidimicrobiales bacterium]
MSTTSSRTSSARRWSVVSGLIQDGGSLLLVANRRRNGSIDWSPPGGVIDPGEVELGALTREVAEETGLVVSEWSDPVYDVTVDFGERGGELLVVVYRALAWSGEISIDDPDEIVHEAAFHPIEQCHERLCSAPAWVADPLLDWLREGFTELRSYAYRVVGGTDLSSLVVERLR